MKELLQKPLKKLALILALAATLTACRGVAAAQDGERYLPVFQDDRMGLYFLDTETIQRQEGGDVLWGTFSLTTYRVTLLLINDRQRPNPRVATA